MNYEEAAATQTPFQAGWGYRQQITIDHTKVYANLTDFPVLINTTNANWKSTGNGGYVGQADGGDFLFTAADGVTKLNYQIEKYDPTTGQLVAWVRVPSLSTVTDTTIDLYYGNAAAVDQWNPQGVWDANYKGVWHQDEASGNFADSTSNGNTGTDGVSATGKTGKIGSGQQFDGIDDNIGVATFAVPTTGTISLWWNPDETLSGVAHPLWRTVSGTNLFDLVLWTNNDIYAGWYQSGNDDRARWTISGISPGRGNYVTATWTNGGTTTSLYGRQ